MAKTAQFNEDSIEDMVKTAHEEAAATGAAPHAPQGSQAEHASVSPCPLVAGPARRARTDSGLSNGFEFVPAAATGMADTGAGTGTGTGEAFAPARVVASTTPATGDVAPAKRDFAHSSAVELAVASFTRRRRGDFAAIALRVFAFNRFFCGAALIFAAFEATTSFEMLAVSLSCCC